MPTYEEILFKSGDLFLPKGVRRVLEYYYVGNDKSVFYMTNWTIIHFLSGVLFAYFFRNFSVIEILVNTILVHSIWELWQIYGENTKINTLRGQVDVIVDTVAYMIGVVIYIYFKKSSKISRR
jgi:hypothetical protein